MRFVLFAILLFGLIATIRSDAGTDKVQIIKPTSVSQSETTKDQLASRLDKMKETVSKQVHSMRQLGQVDLADRLNTLVNDLSQAKDKLSKLNPATSIGQAGIERLKGILARMEDRLNNRSTSKP